VEKVVLMSLRGSPAGLGIDIGGSIRVPAGFNGLYGIRSSAGRMPYEGMANSMVSHEFARGFQLFPCHLGPIAS